MSDKSQIPEIGTPEYDEYMIRQHDENESRFSGDVPKDESNTPELPEGVSFDDLLALWKEKNQSQSTGEQDQQQAATGEQDDKPEEANNSDDKSEGESEVDKLRKQVEAMQEEQTLRKVFDEAGGEQAFNSLRTNAEQVLDETQLGLLNMALVEGTPEQAVAAVRMMKLLFSSNPDAPNIEGQRLDSAPLSGGSGYATETDFHAALQNPLYREQSARGEVYREQVKLKLASSSF